MVFGIQVFNLEHDPAGKTIVYRTSNLSSAGEMYGKTVLGTLRRTFIFNEAGTLERIIEKVDTKNAAGQILEQ